MVDKAFLENLLNCGSLLRAKGKRDVSDWSRAVKIEMGSAAEPFLADLWDFLALGQQDTAGLVTFLRDRGHEIAFGAPRQPGRGGPDSSAAAAYQQNSSVLAASLGSFIVTLAGANAETIESELQEVRRRWFSKTIKDREFQILVQEFVILFLHFCDREVFRSLGARGRGEFMNLLLWSVNAAGIQGPMNRRHAILAFVQTVQGIGEEGIDTDLLNARQHVYHSLKVFAAKDEPQLSRTLLWEFGKHVVDICDASSDFPQLQMIATLTASQSLVKLIESCLIPHRF